MNKKRNHQTEVPTNKEIDVRVALRVPAPVHNRIRRRAEEQRLSVNQAIVQAMEMFSGTPSSEMRQEIRDLVDVCKVLGPELNSQFRRALSERVKSVYGLELSIDFCAAEPTMFRGGEAEAIQSER